MKMAPDAKQIVIVGGGLGGLTLATKLGHRYRSSANVNVSLVDRAPIHVWKPMLHTFAAGTSNAHYEGVPLIAQAKRAGFTYLPGELHDLDPTGKTISLRLADLPGKEVLHHTFTYDSLVLAIGSEANDFGVPGVSKHCYFIDSLGRAEALNQALRAELAYSIIHDRDIHVAIVGGGATGVEFAADIANLGQLGESFGALDLSSKLKITLLNAGPSLLPGFPDPVVQQVSEKLTELGVTILNDARVTHSKTDGFTLSDGQHMPAQINVWAAGTKAPSLFSEIGLFELSRGGALVVDDRLCVSPFTDIYALGDCASFVPSEQDRPLPPTGQVARQQAAYLSTAIPLALSSKQPSPFVYRDQGTLVSLGRFGGYGELVKQGPVPSIAIRGWMARIAHSLFYRMHQIGLFGIGRGFIIVGRDMLDRFVRPSIRLD